MARKRRVAIEKQSIETDDRGWSEVPFERALSRERFTVGKVNLADYRRAGRFPIIDQGQQRVAGYWDEERDVYQGPLPIVIFGDHTRAVKFITDPFVCGADGTKVLLPNTDLFDPEFFFYALLNVKLPSRGYNRHFPLLRDVALTCPPVQEQRVIASMLRAVQQAKDATEKVIAATRELKRSLMRHLFTYGPVPLAEAEDIRLQENEIGPMPKHWRGVRLGDLAKIGNGSTPKRTNAAYWESGTLPWLTSGKIYDEFIKKADQFVTDQAVRECHLPLVPADSVLVAITGQGKTLGNAALVEMDTYISQHLAYIQLQGSPTLMPEFLLRFLQLKYDHLRSVANAGGSTKGALTCGFLRSYVVPVPPLEEQAEIARTLRVVHQRLRSEESRSVSLGHIFTSLLSELMVGTRRVVIAEATGV